MTPEGKREWFGMRIGRRGVLLCIALLLCLACSAPASAGDKEYAEGEVLFVSRYAEYASLRDTGLRLGAASWEGASLALGADGLAVSSSSDYKTWLLLPPDLPFPDTYTMVCTFRFTELLAANGACGLLLTSSGPAPSNRTEAVVRASGDCGDFGQLGRTLAGTIAAGGWTTVRVPIRHGMLSELEVSAGGETETLALKNVRSVAAGGRGFVFRNASVEIASVGIVCGAESAGHPYDGWRLARSYVAPDDFAWEERRPAGPADGPSPHTADAALPLLLTGCAAAAAARRMRKRKEDS